MQKRALHELTGKPSPNGTPTLEPDHPLFGLGYATPVVRRAFLHLGDGTVGPQNATVAEETPVALIYNGRPHAVMMCTPADIEDFAFGFTLTEQIVARAGDISSLASIRYSSGIEVAVAIPEAAADALANRGRALVGRTGCGLCGVTTIDQALRSGNSIPGIAPIAPAAILRAAQELPEFQYFNEGTNAVHAAAWATREGRIVLAREDVGRHNALDKLIGAMVRADLETSDGFVVVTSRASYELIQKCAVVGIALLAAISRPTGLAIRMAEAAGITLVGLVRGRSANAYTHAARLGFEASAPEGVR